MDRLKDIASNVGKTENEHPKLVVRLASIVLKKINC